MTARNKTWCARITHLPIHIAIVISMLAAGASMADTVVCLVDPTPDEPLAPRLNYFLPLAANAAEQSVLDGFVNGINSMKPWAIAVPVTEAGDSDSTISVSFHNRGNDVPFDVTVNPTTMTANGFPVFAGGELMINTTQFPSNPAGNELHGFRAAWHTAFSIQNIDPANDPFLLPSVPHLNRIANATAACGQLPGTHAGFTSDLAAAMDTAVADGVNVIAPTIRPTPVTTSCPFFQDVAFRDFPSGVPIQNLDSSNDIEVEIHISKNNGPGCTPPVNGIIRADSSLTSKTLEWHRVSFAENADYHLYDALGLSTHLYRLLKTGEDIKFTLIDGDTGEAWASRTLPITDNFRRTQPEFVNAVNDGFYSYDQAIFFDYTWAADGFSITTDAEDTPATLTFDGPFARNANGGSPIVAEINSPGTSMNAARIPLVNRSRWGDYSSIQVQNIANEDSANVRIEYMNMRNGGASAPELHDTFKQAFLAENLHANTAVLGGIAPNGLVSDVAVDQVALLPRVDGFSADNPQGFSTLIFYIAPTTVPRGLAPASQLSPAASNVSIPVAYMDISDPDRIATELRNVGSGAFLGTVDFLGASFTARGFGTLPDMNGNGAMEAMALAVRNSTGEIIVQVRDTGSGDRLSNIYFLGPGFEPWQLLRLDDQNGNGAAEILVLAVRRSDNAMIYQMRDGMTGDLLQNRYILGSGFVPVRFIAMPDTDNDGIPQIAVLARRVSDGRFVVQVVNATGIAAKHNAWFLGPQYIPLDLSIVPDSNGDGQPEILVLAIRQSDGRFLVQVRNAAGASAPRNYWFLNADYEPLRVLGIPDTDGDGVPEIAVLAWRFDQDGQFLVQIRNSSGPASPKNIFFMEPGFTPLSLFAFLDDDVQGGLRIGVVARRFTDNRLRTQIRIPRGPAQPYDIWFKPAN